MRRGSCDPRCNLQPPGIGGLAMRLVANHAIILIVWLPQSIVRVIARSTGHLGCFYLVYGWWCAIYPVICRLLEGLWRTTANLPENEAGSCRRHAIRTHHQPIIWRQLFTPTSESHNWRRRRPIYVKYKYSRRRCRLMLFQRVSVCFYWCDREVSSCVVGFQ